mmetsp:Transcript_18747/g.46861  ORF Transcript_18747/g.46861 Transcript_18747/m.46861 type:complete len:264 (+) Transcript_18747:219-1010(+)
MVMQHGHSFPSRKKPSTAATLSPKNVHDSSADPDLEAATPDAPLHPRVLSSYGTSSRGPTSSSLVLRLRGGFGGGGALAPWPAERPSSALCGPLWLPILFAAVGLVFHVTATGLEYHPEKSMGGKLIIVFHTLSCALQAAVIIMRHPVCSDRELSWANLLMMIVGVAALVCFFTAALPSPGGAVAGKLVLSGFWLYWIYQMAHSIFLAVDITRISASSGLFILMGIGFGLNAHAFAFFFIHGTVSNACQAAYILVVAIVAYLS